MIRLNFNLISSSDSNLKYSNISYRFIIKLFEFVYLTHLVINFLVNNLCTLSIWSMRLRNLLIFEKGDQRCIFYIRLNKNI